MTRQEPERLETSPPAVLDECVGENLHTVQIRFGLMNADESP